MSTLFKTRMLKAFAHKPCSLRTFTEANITLAMPIIHIEKYAAELEADGLAFERDGEWHATEYGHDLMARTPTMAEPRQWCSASTKEAYVPKAWSVRAGADNHLSCRSIGIDSRISPAYQHHPSTATPLSADFPA